MSFDWYFNKCIKSISVYVLSYKILNRSKENRNPEDENSEENIEKNKTSFKHALHARNHDLRNLRSLKEYNAEIAAKLDQQLQYCLTLSEEELLDTIWTKAF